MISLGDIYRLLNNPVEQADPQEKQFILAINSLRTLKAQPGESMSIDPEELREQIVASRQRCTGFVSRSGH